MEEIMVLPLALILAFIALQFVGPFAGLSNECYDECYKTNTTCMIKKYPVMGKFGDEELKTGEMYVVYEVSSPDKKYPITKELTNLCNFPRKEGETWCYTFTNERHPDSPPHQNCYTFCDRSIKF